MNNCAVLAGTTENFAGLVSYLKSPESSHLLENACKSCQSSSLVVAVIMRVVYFMLPHNLEQDNDVIHSNMAALVQKGNKLGSSVSQILLA